ncbi:SRPBCC domain-containing protein [Pararhodonellum marinum]|uniref:SRPBCC domain-containing protein n=1 Tax=Pararhodonellum marinum TaxID=2755358 RepID=UPI0018904C6C|nr:SRPBCC domain-containing protein [Pararhodonellum marinum]
MKIKTEIIINASKEKVWDLLTDLEQYQNWNPFIVKSSGKVAPGNIVVNTMKNGEGTITFKPKILKVEPLHYFDWMGRLWVKGLFDGHHYFKIEPLGPEQVKLVHGENFSGILSSMILKKIGEQTRENFVKMNQAVKVMAESKQVSASSKQKS